jgi:hypothetical protein
MWGKISKSKIREAYKVRENPVTYFT